MERCRYNITLKCGLGDGHDGDHLWGDYGSVAANLERTLGYLYSVHQYIPQGGPLEERVIKSINSIKRSLRSIRETHIGK